MITLVQIPSHYSPSGNPIIFQVNSSFANVVYFKVELLEVGTNAVISVSNIYTTPDYPTGSYIDLQRILSNTVNYQVNNTQNLLSYPIDKPILKYKLRFTERGIVNGLMVDLGAALTTQDFYVWEATFNRFAFHSFNHFDYVMSTSLPVKFLTEKPDGGTVNDYTAEQLYFMHNAEDVLKVVVKTYDRLNNNLNIYTYSIPELLNYHIFRLQISPKTLKQSLLADFTNVDYYTVHLEDEAAKRKTEVRRYVYKKLPCHLEPTNMLWVNSLGGVDSYQFVNVQESTQYTKNTYKKNTFKIDNGLYVDRSADTWNAEEDIIDVSLQGSYLATSRVISDKESYWFNGLFASKKVFIELNDASLVPVLVKDTQYNIQRQKYNRTTPTTIQVNYTFSGDIIPHEFTELTAGIGNGQAQIDFIDAQMNTSSSFDTILLFNSSVTDGKEGAGGAVAAIDNNLKFEFNKITPLYGLTQNMEIYSNGVLVMVIDYLNDYTGKEFRFTDASGQQHYSTFQNAEIHF